MSNNFNTNNSQGGEPLDITQQPMMGGNGGAPPQNFNPQPPPPPQPMPVGQPLPPIPQSYNVPTLPPLPPEDLNAPQFNTNGGLVQPEGGKKLDIKKFLPFIIIGIVGIIVLIIVVSLLFGNKETQQQTPQKVVLQWWGVFMDPESVKPLIDEYQNQHQNVTIEYANKWSEDLPFEEARTRYKGDVDRVLKANDSVQIPDIFMVHNTWAGDYEKFVKPSSTYTSQTFSSSFYPAVSVDFAHNGQVYGVPLWIDTFAVLYNKDLLASNAVLNIPDDWATFKALAQNLTKRTNGKIQTAGFAAGISSNTSFGFDLANILLLQNGVNMVDNTDKPSFSTDPDSVAALQFYKDFALGSNATWSSDFENDSAAFLEGKVAMIVAPSYRLRDILKYNEQYGLNLDIGVAQIPQLQGQDQEIINWPDYWGNMAALNRPNSTAAWEFLNWISQPDQLKKLSENIKTKEGNFGIIYPRSDMSEELASDQYLQVYNESLPFIKNWYMVKGVEVEAAFTSVLDGNSISQSQVTTLEKNIQTIMSNKGKL